MVIAIVIVQRYDTFYPPLLRPMANSQSHKKGHHLEKGSMGERMTDQNGKYLELFHEQVQVQVQVGTVFPVFFWWVVY